MRHAIRTQSGVEDLLDRNPGSNQNPAIRLDEIDFRRAVDGVRDVRQDRAELRGHFRAHLVTADADGRSKSHVDIVRPRTKLIS